MLRGAGIGRVRFGLGQQAQAAQQARQVGRGGVHGALASMSRQTSQSGVSLALSLARRSSTASHSVLARSALAARADGTRSRSPRGSRAMRRHGVIRKGTPGPDAAPALRARARPGSRPRRRVAWPAGLAHWPLRCRSAGLVSRGSLRTAAPAGPTPARRAVAGGRAPGRRAARVARTLGPASVWTCGRFSNACAVCAACCHDPEETSACSRAEIRVRAGRQARQLGRMRDGVDGGAQLALVGGFLAAQFQVFTDDGVAVFLQRAWNTGSPASGRRASSMSAASASMNAWRTAPSGAWAEASAACSGSMARASRAMGLSGSGCATAPGRPGRAPIAPGYGAQDGGERGGRLVHGVSVGRGKSCRRRARASRERGGGTSNDKPGPLLRLPAPQT